MSGDGVAGDGDCQTAMKKGAIVRKVPTIRRNNSRWREAVPAWQYRGILAKVQVWLGAGEEGTLAVPSRDPPQYGQNLSPGFTPRWQWGQTGCRR